MKVLLWILILLSLALSPNLLYVAGTGYTQAEGPALLKIHPLTYILILLFILNVAINKRNLAGYFSDKYLLGSILAIMLLTVYCIALGFSVSVAVVSLLTPLLFLHAASRLKRGKLNELEIWLRLLLGVNAIVGVYEIIAGSVILPRIAGDILVLTDQRSMGFVGHPLASSFLSGSVVIYLLYRLVFFKQTALNRLFIIMELGLHVAALVAFASRANIVIISLLLLFMVLLHQSKDRNRGQIIWRIIAAVSMLGVVVILAQSDYAEVAVARFMGDEYSDRSTQSRFTLLALLASMNISEWLMGVTLSRRQELQEIFDTTYGVEVTWISWILSFGLLWTIYLSWNLIRTLAVIAFSKGASHVFMLAFFLLSITSAQGLGGKTLMLLWFLSILLCFRGSKEAAFSYNFKIK